MQGRCDKHNFEAAEANCRNCGYEFCVECLVYSFGPSKPPFCIPCAVAAAGIRSTAGNRPMINRKQMKRLERDQRALHKRNGTTPDPVEPLAPTTKPKIVTPVSFEWAVSLEVDSGATLAS